MPMATAEEIARAWHGVFIEYTARKNKARTDELLWEVVRIDERLPLGDNNPTVVIAYRFAEQAEAKARRLNDVERGSAVLAFING